jgi:predicted dehydrogenase
MSHKQPSRREFLQTSTAIAGAAALAGGLSIARTAHAKGSDALKVALIGCGGRGKGAVSDHLNAVEGTTVIAVADAFEKNAQTAVDHLHKAFPSRTDIPPERMFVGLDAYEKAIAAGPDLCIFATPPGFRPYHYRAAIQAGKHVFMEKPCCVDAVGYNILMQANQLAEDRKLKVGVGFQRRHMNRYKETIQRIHDGALGKLMLLQAFWNGGGIWNRKHEPDDTELMYQVRNWYHFCWLSGDNICEQHIHNLDVCNWAFDKQGDPKLAHPVEANGMGGCTQRYVGEFRGTGQIFDHHFVEFTYADGTKMFSQCRQIPHTWTSITEAMRGTEGDAAPGLLTGKCEWKFDAKQSTQKFKKEMEQEHYDLVTAIRGGQPYCEGWHGASSSMTAVLGRMATYSGQIVKWDDAVAKGKTEMPQGKLAWNTPAPVCKDKDGLYPIPVPGAYKPY